MGVGRKVDAPGDRDGRAVATSEGARGDAGRRELKLGVIAEFLPGDGVVLQELRRKSWYHDVASDGGR